MYRPSSDCIQKSSLYVIIHGGYWENVWNIDNALIDTLPEFLTKSGHFVCSIEYRRSDHIGGGWPGTNDDIISALNLLHQQQSTVGLAILVCSVNQIKFSY